MSVGQAGYAEGPAATPIVTPALPVAPLFQGTTPTGYSPSQIRSAYGLNQISFGSVSGTGAGQTIAIIDAYFDPNISSDLATFDAQYGLSAPLAFTQYVERGMFYDNSGWALETALDVEWAHAIAPAANIVLVETQPDLSDLLNAVTFASNLPGVSVVSMSWGAGEFSGETADNSIFTTPKGHNGVTFVASSGDTGTTEYPSVSPNVLAVGGTTLNIASSGGVTETGWSGTGTGFSPYESAPTWQTSAISANGLKPGSRTAPDVAWDASPSTGVSVYDSVPYSGKSGWFTVGGTSVGAPSWAGLIAIADQGLALNGVGSLSNAQASLYQLSGTDFNHPTSGSSGSSSSVTYGLVTGLGSPKANLLVPALVKLNTPTSTPATKSTAVAPKSTTPVAGRASLLAPSQTNATATGTGSTSSSTSSSTSTTSITPLNPSLTSTQTPGSLTPVFVVPPTLPPIVNYLGLRVSPVTVQAIYSPLAALDEQPTSLTQFGQAYETELERFLKAQLSPKQDPAPLIDVVEPFQPLGPVEAPDAEPARDPRGARLLSPGSEPEVGGAPALTERNALAGALGRTARSAKALRDGTAPSWGFSTLFGAAALAAGGYQLAIREADRFHRRRLPRLPAINSPERGWQRVSSR